MALDKNLLETELKIANGAYDKSGNPNSSIEKQARKALENQAKAQAEAIHKYVQTGEAGGDNIH